MPDSSNAILIGAMQGEFEFNAPYSMDHPEQLHFVVVLEIVRLEGRSIQ
jgi:hypothetical protein